MKRKFFTNLILLLAVNLLVKPFWLFGIDRKVQIITGDDYGLYMSLFALTITFNVLLDMGITNYNNRNIARYNHLLPKHLGNILGLKFILLLVYAVIVLGWAGLVGYDKVQLHLLIFLIINQFLLQLILYLRSNLSALHLFTTDSLVSVLDRVFMISFCGILLFTNITNGVFRIEWFVYIQTVSYILAAIIILLIVFRKSGLVKPVFNLKFNLVFIKKTYPYAILILLMAFYNRFDQVLIERLLPNEGIRQVAIYAHGYRLLDAASMFGVLFAGMLLPIFSRMIKLKESISDMVRFSFSLIIFISVTLAITSWFYQVEIMQWMKYDHVQASAPIFAILMFCFIPISITYIFGTLLTANGSIKQLNVMAAFGMALNLVVNLFVIPKYQAFGASVVGLFTQSVTALAQVGIALYIFKFRINYRIIGQIALFVALVVGFGHLSHRYFTPFAGMMLMLVASTVAAFFIRLIDLKNLFQILTRREPGMAKTKNKHRDRKMSVKNPSPEQLHNHLHYTLLAEVDYLQIKSFIVEVLQRKTPLLLVYGIFQMLSVATLGYFVAYYLGSGNLNKFFWLLGGIVFSFTLLIPAHELLHALAFKVLGKSNIGFGAQLKKFIFYAEAHRQVVNRKEITIVALTPLLVVGIICSLLIFLCYNQPAGMVALGIFLIHPMFCGGDLAIVAYFKKYAPLQMYSYDDRELKKTYYFIENEATSL